MLDFEEAVVPSVLYIWLVKREGVLHCTQNKKKFLMCGMACCM